MTSTSTSDFDLEHGDAVALLACQSQVLEQMSARASLTVMLNCITTTLEWLLPDTHCSVLLLDRDTGVLRHGSAPTLPATYLAAIDGLVPAIDAGSCGTAAFLAQPVVVADVQADPRWAGYRDVAAAAGLRACWSSPILGNAAQVVGTFAVYHGDVHVPNAREQRLVERLTYLASVAVEHEVMIGALTVSEERFRRSFEDNAVAMALLDTAGRFTRVNEAMVVLTGLPAAKAMTQTLLEVVHGADRAEVTRLIHELVEGRRRSAHAEFRVCRADGGLATVSAILSQVRVAAAGPVQLTVNLLDISERLAAAQERHAREEAETARRSAESASRAKSAFLAAVSHEMRTPLQAITGFTELLATLELDAGRQAEALAHISTGAAHLLELVDETLDLSRIEAGALPLKLEPVDIEPLIADVLDFLAPLASQHRVELANGTAVGAVLADRRRLRQVLINLVSNGIRYGGHGSTVTVSASPGLAGDKRAQIVVIDDGPGIDPALWDRLFEPFAGDGTGLGLMLAQGLVEAMGGSLTLADGTDGSGTSATVELRFVELRPAELRPAEGG